MLGPCKQTGCQHIWASNKNHNPSIQLSRAVIRELEGWHSQLETPLFRWVFTKADGTLSLWAGRGSADLPEVLDTLLDTDVVVFETDAAKTLQWGYYRCADSHAVGGPFPAWLADADINVKELWTITHKMVPNERSNWHGKRVLVRCDNASAVSYLNKRHGKVLGLRNLLDGLEDAEKEFRFALVAVHIKGKFNVIADAASRNVAFPEAWNSDPSRDLQLKRAAFALVLDRIGVHFDVDAWASRCGSNAMAPRWHCPEKSAFLLNMTGLAVWAFPPQTVVRSWLQHVMACSPRVCATVVFANHKALPAHFVKKLEANFRKIVTWKKGSRCFIAGDADETHRDKTRSSLIKADFETWVLIYPKAFNPEAPPGVNLVQPKAPAQAPSEHKPG